MIDFSKATIAKNHKNSFQSDVKKILEYVQGLGDSYNELWNEFDVIKEERDSYLESVSQIIKNAGIKGELSNIKSDNENLIDNLKALCNKVSESDSEEIEIAIIRIKNRNDKLNKIGLKLEELSDTLSMIHVAEEDFDDEVVLNFDSVAEEPVKEIEVEETKEEEKTEIENIIDTELENVEEEKETEVEIEEDSKEYLDYTLSDDIPLKTYAKNVYGSDKYWKNIYEYEDNKEKIDEIALEKGMTAEKICTKSGELNGVTLKFPLQIVTYD